MSELLTNCYYRENGVFCWGGYLHATREPNDPVLVEDERVVCPACSGKTVIPTEEGKNVLRFLEIFAPAQQ